MVGSGNTTLELRTAVLFGGKDRYHINVQTSLSAYCIPDTRINIRVTALMNLIRVTALMNLGNRCNLARKNTSSPSYLRFKVELIACKQRWLSSADCLLRSADSFLDTVCLCAQSLSCARLFATPWTVDRQAPLSVGFSRQEYWSGLPFPSTGDLPNAGIKPASPTLTDGFFTSDLPEKPSWTLAHLKLTESPQSI